MPETTIHEDSGLPENWVPVDAAPVNPNFTPPQPNDKSNYYQTSISPSFQHDTSFVGTKYGNPGIPQTSLMPLGVQGNPVSNAAVQSTITKIISEGGGSGILLETNGIRNPEQTVLNLEAGSGISIASDSNGGVKFSSSGGDGLVHGDPIWEHDSAYIELRDDFTFGNNIGNSFVGELGWNVTVASGTAQMLSGGFPNIGQVELWNGNITSANAGAYIQIPKDR